MRIVASSLAVLSISLAFLLVNVPHAIAEDVAKESLNSSTPGTATPSMQPLATDLVPSSPDIQITRPAKPSRVSSRPARAATVFATPFTEPQVTSQTKQALGFYGGYAARATLSQQPRRTPLQGSASRPLFRPLKPFQTVYREPTVSPYLNLHRDEANTDGAPNYFAFVRPQLDQIEANRGQQREIQQLRGQLQSSAAVVGPQYRADGLPGTGTPARYMDTAQFYSGLRR